jgi:glycosyltransferase involved in cell wall biosynthesis
MIADRTELNNQLNIKRFFPPFFSVLIPELGRPDYAIKCVDSIHRYSDMPIEVILHDDGSGQEKQRILYDNLKAKVSTLVYNMGYNTGLARSFNRCKLMASSDYLIGFNSDVYVTSHFLKAMKEALDLPYAGIVNVTTSLSEGEGVYVTPGGYKISIAKSTGCCHCFGIRREVWEEVNGWDENVQTTASDVGFVGSIFGKGYFTLFVEGTITNEMWPKSSDGKVNTPGSNPDYIDAARFTRNDNNVPPIFKMRDINYHKEACEARRSAIWHGVNDAQNEERFYPQWYNSNFQCQEIAKLFPNDKFIDWEFAKVYGHDKFKDRIIKDFNIKG